MMSIEAAITISDFIQFEKLPLPATARVHLVENPTTSFSFSPIPHSNIIDESASVFIRKSHAIRLRVFHGGVIFIKPRCIGRERKSTAVSSESNRALPDEGRAVIAVIVENDARLAEELQVGSHANDDGGETMDVYMTLGLWFNICQMYGVATFETQLCTLAVCRLYTR
jgi:hypothetical protein